MRINAKHPLAKGMIAAWVGGEKVSGLPIVEEGMMHVTIQTIPHADQRYPTVGDWAWVDDHNLVVRVSHLGDRRYEALVAVHELVEALLCREHGVTTEAADAFDIAFEGDGEPGFAPDCPYRREHTDATAIEIQLAVAMEVDWDEYGKAVSAL